jgi:branched-chain amino acid transport system substrate-binding protein
MIRTTRRWRVIAAVAAAGLALTACGTTDDGDGDGGTASGDAACDLKIGFFGALTGPSANLGVNIKNGVELAVTEYNEENADCKVTLEEYDSQGSETEAPKLAQQAIDDTKVVGVVGPAFSGESKAAGPLFAEAGLPTITPSATDPTLAENGWDTFHRMLGNDASQGPAIATYIDQTVGSTKVFVADDASQYGKGLAGIVEEALGDKVVGTDTIQVGDTDFSALVTSVKSSGADTMFFGGYIAEAGLILKQLRQGGWDGQYVVADGAKDPLFVETAGAANAEGTIISCPCIPPEDEAVAPFAEAFQAAYDTAAGTYTAEGYDAANVLLDGIADGASDRAAMLEFVNGYEEDGVTKRISFDEKGEPAEIPIYAYKVEDGQIVSGELIE